MNNLLKQEPFQKTRSEKPAKPRKRMRAKSAKRIASEDREYLEIVVTLPCADCGATHRPREPHHCSSRPPAVGFNPYKRGPCAGRRSHDHDAIPLCKFYCHNGGPKSYHKSKRKWEAEKGPDYQHIPATRAAVEARRGSVDF